MFPFQNSSGFREMLPETHRQNTLLTTSEGEIYVIDTMRAIYKSSHADNSVAICQQR